MLVKLQTKKQSTIVLMYSEDDDPAHSSKKLASLFERSTSHGGNSSLMYKPPKQPKTSVSSSPSNTNRQQSKETLNLILLKVVQAFKFENDSYVGQGKLGAAILGNINTHQYQLILYREKTSHITHAQITSQFWFAIQPKNYASFRDKNNVLWSLLFENSSSLIKFSIEIALARRGCVECLESIIVQDLSCVESKPNERKAKDGSQVEVTYTVRSISATNKLDKEVEMKEKCLINLSTNDGWSSFLIGSVEGSRKFIILPPKQLGKWKSAVQQNESIALEVEVLSVDQLPMLPNVATEEVSRTSEASSVKIKGVSISEALSTKSQSSKSSLISRMARMGQATLPLKGARVPELSDSDDTEDDIVSERPVEKHTEQPKSTSLVDESLAIAQINTAPPVFANHQVTSAANFASAATSPLESHLSVFFSELRTNNSELRMGLSRVTDKVEKVIDKMEVCSFERVLDQLKSMETNMISQMNILQQKNMELINNMAEVKDNGSFEISHKDSIEQLRRENKELEEALAQCGFRAKELQEKVMDLNNLKSDLHEQLTTEQRNREIIDQEHSSVITQLQDQLREQEKTISFWTEALQKISKRVPELERKIEERQRICSKKEKTVKKLMTTVYRKLHARFPQDSSVYSASDIHAALRDIIKATTLEYLNSQSNRKQEANFNRGIKNLPLVSTADAPVEELKTSNLKKDIPVVEHDKKQNDEGSTVHSGSTTVKDVNTYEHSIEEKEHARISGKDEFTTCDKANVDSSSSPDSAVDRKLDTEDTKTTSTKDGIGCVLKSQNASNIPLQSEKTDYEASEQCSIKQTVIGSSSKLDQDSSAEVWSPKQPPPLFDDEDSESDDSWLK